MLNIFHNIQISQSKITIDSLFQHGLPELLLSGHLQHPGGRGQRTRGSHETVEGGGGSHVHHDGSDRTTKQGGYHCEFDSGLIH